MSDIENDNMLHITNIQNTVIRNVNIKSILHITNWYPNQWNQNEALFVKEHFDACKKYVDQQLWHVQVRNEGALFRIHVGDYSTNEHYLILETRIQRWRLQELLTLFLLALLRIKLSWRAWDVVNVHIAYPLLRFPGLFRFLFGKCVVITEHWSAYRSNFHLPEGGKAKRRIQEIFKHGIPVITVSRALMNDIICFAGTDDFPQYIVPNVVNSAIFCPADSPYSNKAPVFLMVAFWASIKRPLLAMTAFSNILAEYPNAMLRIVGCGQQWDDMEAFVRERRLEGNISLLAPMTKSAIASEMCQADCFLHASQYETFSVVCAEALCCGLPVIASNVGGIPEFVDTSSGILVENTQNAWTGALQSFLMCQDRWDPYRISEKAISQFNQNVVGAKLTQIFKQSIVCN